jgi:hypothetical protein
VSTIEELFGRKRSGSGLEIEITALGIDTLYSQKRTLTSPTSGGYSVGVVRSWTEATEFVSLKERTKGYCRGEYRTNRRAICGPPSCSCLGMLQLSVCLTN